MTTSANKPGSKRKPARKAKPELRPREALFVAGVLRGKSHKQAALEAGYSEAMADNAGQKILSREPVQAALAAWQNDVRRAVVIDAEQLHRDWSDMWQADIADIINKDTGEYKPIHDWPLIWRRMVKGMKVRELFARSHDGEASEKYSWDKIGQVVTIRFLEMTKLAELLGKHRKVDAFVSQKVEADLNVKLTLEQVTAALQAGRERLAKARS